MSRRRQMIQSQRCAPGTAECIRAISSRLEASEMSSLGHVISRRVNAISSFSTMTIPPSERERHCFRLAYLIAWIFAMDVLIDSCPSAEHAVDFSAVVRRRLELPFDAELVVSEVDLTHDPRRCVPGTSYSIMSVAELIQPLRRDLRALPEGRAGLDIFDGLLLDKVLPAEVAEATWRLARDRTVDLERYLSVASDSICGHLTASVVNAGLAEPETTWATMLRATTRMGRANRLINDLNSVERDREAGSLNAVGRLAARHGDAMSARARVLAMIEDDAREIDALCAPHLGEQNKGSSAYVLGFYVTRCLATCEAMYAGGDFVSAV